MRKTISIVLALTVVLASVWSEGQKEKKEPVIMRFASTRLLAQDQGKITKMALDGFAAKKGIQIEWEESAGNDLQTKVKLDAMANRLPDVFAYWRLDPVFGLADIARSNKLADLTTWVNSDTELKNRYDSSAWRTASLDGKIYGIPFNMFYVVVYANKAILDKAGVPIPQTWNDWVAAVNTIKKAGLLPWGISLSKDSQGGRLYNYVVNRVVGNQKALAIHSGQEPYNTAEMRKAASLMKELIIGFTAPDANALDNEAVFAKYVNSGQAAFFIDGSWMVGRIVPDVAKNMVPLAFPLVPGGMEDSTRVEKDLTNLYYTSKASWDDPVKQPLIKELLKELSGADMSKKFFGIGQPPAFRGLEPDPNSASALSIDAYKLASKFDGNKWIVSVMSPEQRTGFEPLMNQYLDGKVELDQFLGLMDKVLRK